MASPIRIAALLALTAAGAARAEPLAFTHAATLYADAKGVALQAPEAVACTASTVVVGDTGAGRLVLYPVKDGVVAGGTEVKLSAGAVPSRVQIDPKGNVLLLDRRARRIVRIGQGGAPLGAVRLEAAGAGVVPGAFKLDADGNVVVLDVGMAPSVLVIDAAGGLVRRLPLPAGEFTDVAAGADGTLYAVEAGAAVVYAAPKAAPPFKPLGKPLKEVMNFPGYLAVTPGGNLVLVDQNGMGLVVLGPDGSYQGRQLSIGWTPGLVYYPGQICVDGGGLAYVADRGNNRVQVFALR